MFNAKRTVEIDTFNVFYTEKLWFCFLADFIDKFVNFYRPHVFNAGIRSRSSFVRRISPVYRTTPSFPSIRNLNDKRAQ